VNVDVSIIKYLGKVESGIITLITLKFIKENVAFDATFYYTEDRLLLTVPPEVEEVYGHIEKHPYYEEIIRICLKKVVPYDKMIDSIDPLDVKPYLKAMLPNEKFD
jgi:hypothetical protein